MDHTRQPDQQLVVQRSVDTEAWLQRENVLSQDLLGGLESPSTCRLLLVLETLLQEADHDSVHQQQRHEQEEGVDQKQALRV